MPFTYPPLPPVDGLRILTLEPATVSPAGSSGSFSSPLRASLAPVAFSSKPKYIALSYTWADQDETHASLPIPIIPDPSDPTEIPDRFNNEPVPEGRIILNGQPFPIGHNLALALLYIRSDNEPIHLWVDQICIDQSSIPERNAQVALMAFIFTRASAVVAWLGVADIQPPSNMSQADYMRIKWESGRGKQLAKLARPPSTSSAKGKAAAPPWKPQFSDSPSNISLTRNNPYWQRLWVVQEVCLPRTVVFLHGGYLWSQEQVRASLKLGGSDGKVAESAVPMNTLLSTRDERFSEAMNLEMLIEKFADCGCTNIRDKVYGLLGLANDVESAPASTTTMTTATAAPAVQAGGRGRGAITIDYTRNFWEIFCDVITFMTSWSRPRFDPCHFCPDQTEEERCVRAVRFAGILQNAFQGKVQQDVQSIDTSADETMLTVKGYIAGKIQHIGPQYSKFVGSYAEEQAWISSWHGYYSSADELGKLREMEDAYVAKIIDYTDHDIAHIRGIFPPAAVVWHVARSRDPPKNDNKLPKIPQTPEEEPARFLGTDYCMGLAPSNAEPGDLVVRFWNCDAAVVVRQVNESTVREAKRVFGVVGRADIAEPWKRRVGPDIVGRNYLATHWDAKDELHDCSQFEVASDKAVYVRMDYETLQKITADIST